MSRFDIWHPYSCWLVSRRAVPISARGPRGPGVKADADQAKAPQLSKQRLMLSEGYSMLYRDASKLDLAELLLYVKVESEAVDKIVTAIAEVGGQLKRDLEKIAKDYPGVRIDLDPLPEMEKRKRSATAKDRARYFAPVIGHGGGEYERTVLIGYVNGICRSCWNDVWGGLPDFRAGRDVKAHSDVRCRCHLVNKADRLGHPTAAKGLES
jgi:hypothetical protein